MDSGFYRPKLPGFRITLHGAKGKKKPALVSLWKKIKIKNRKCGGKAVIRGLTTLKYWCSPIHLIMQNIDSYCVAVAFLDPDLTFLTPRFPGEISLPLERQKFHISMPYGKLNGKIIPSEFSSLDVFEVHLYLFFFFGNLCLSSHLKCFVLLRACLIVPEKSKLQRESARSWILFFFPMVDGNCFICGDRLRRI